MDTAKPPQVIAQRCDLIHAIDIMPDETAMTVNISTYAAFAKKTTQLRLSKHLLPSFSTFSSCQREFREESDAPNPIFFFTKMRIRKR